jgi:hypothetical protein
MSLPVVCDFETVTNPPFPPSSAPVQSSRPSRKSAATLVIHGHSDSHKSSSAPMITDVKGSHATAAAAAIRALRASLKMNGIGRRAPPDADVVDIGPFTSEYTLQVRQRLLTSQQKMAQQEVKISQDRANFARIELAYKKQVAFMKDQMADHEKECGAIISHQKSASAAAQAKMNKMLSDMSKEAEKFQEVCSKNLKDHLIMAESELQLVIDREAKTKIKLEALKETHDQLVSKNDLEMKHLEKTLRFNINAMIARSFEGYKFQNTAAPTILASPKVVSADAERVSSSTRKRKQPERAPQQQDVVPRQTARKSTGTQKRKRLVSLRSIAAAGKELN